MKIYLLSLVCIFITGQVFAQSENKTTSKPPPNAVDEYLWAAENWAVLYNGRQQSLYPSHMANHPYLIEEDYYQGVISYDGIEYPNILMRLDLYKNELIVCSPNKMLDIVLQNDRIDFAKLHTYHTIYYQTENLKGAPPNGFYSILYSNDCVVLSKNNCSLTEIRKDEILTGTFNKSTRYYIKKDDVYYTVRNMNGVLSVFKPYKKELKQYIKNNRINFKKNPEQAIVDVVKQYESIKR